MLPGEVLFLVCREARKLRSHPRAVPRTVYFDGSALKDVVNKHFFRSIILYRYDDLNHRISVSDEDDVFPIPYGVVRYIYPYSRCHYFRFHCSCGQDDQHPTEIIIAVTGCRLVRVSRIVRGWGGIVCGHDHHFVGDADG